MQDSSSGMAAEGEEVVGAKQSGEGRAEGGDGGQLSHSTWHVRATSPASRTNGLLPTRASVSNQNSPSQSSNPGAAAKKTSFNMKVGVDGIIVKPGRCGYAMGHGRFPLSWVWGLGPFAPCFLCCTIVCVCGKRFDFT